MKRTKRSVRYRRRALPAVNCHRCTYVELNGDAASTCELVEGIVDREHVCDLWLPPFSLGLP